MAVLMTMMCFTNIFAANKKSSFAVRFTDPTNGKTVSRVVAYCGGGRGVNTTIQCGNYDSWSIEPANSYDAAWVHFGSKKGRNRLAITGSKTFATYFDPNTTPYNRECTFIITCGNKKAKFKITQPKFNYKFALTSSKSLKASMYGGKGKPITISASGNKKTLFATDWEVVSCPKWIRLSQTSGRGSASIIPIFASNASNYNDRDGEIVIQSERAQRSITIDVVQFGKGSKKW